LIGRDNDPIGPDGYETAAGESGFSKQFMCSGTSDKNHLVKVLGSSGAAGGPGSSVAGGINGAGVSHRDIGAVSIRDVVDDDAAQVLMTPAPEVSTVGILPLIEPMPKAMPLLKNETIDVALAGIDMVPGSKIF